MRRPRTKYTALSTAASDLISGLPLILRVNRIYDGPDLRTDEARTLWHRAADSLGQLVRDAEGEERNRIRIWHGDSLICCGRFGEAIAAMPVPDLLERSSLRSSRVLALKLHIGAPVVASDIVGLFGPTFTEFGRIMSRP